MSGYVHMYGARQVGPAPDDLPTTTFGPLAKYRPANDNVPYVAGTFVPHGVDGVSVLKPPAPVTREEVRADGNYRFTSYPSTDSGRPERHGDFMQTATGRKFWPLDPRPEEVFIQDIAHSLSLQCRYAGHCLRFYSVAEHSVLIARKLRWDGAKLALWALLHDAAEAYTVDVPRPLKLHLVGYKEAEARVMAAICQRFGLPEGMPPAVHDADNRIIGDELVNMVPMEWHARYDNPLGVTLKYWTPEQAKEEFMATFTALTGRVS